MDKLFAIYRYAFVLLLALLPHTLYAANDKTSGSEVIPFAIATTVDTVYDLELHTVIYDDTFDLHKSYLGIPASFYKPLNTFSASRNHRVITHVSHFLKFELSNETTDTIRAFYYCGKHNVLTLFSDSISDIQHGGLADYTDATSKLFPNYYLSVTLNPLQTKAFISSNVNYGVVPASMESKLFVCRHNPRIDKLQQPLYYCWLLLTCIVCGGILILGIFNFAQYFTARKPEYFFYGCYAIAMFLNIERAVEWAFNLRIISQLAHNYFFTSATLLNVLAGIFYLFFTRYFLDLNTKGIAANRFLTAAIYFLAIGAAILATAVFLQIDGDWILIAFRILSFAPTICMLILSISIFISLRNSSPLLVYYYVGFILIFIGVSINVYINNFARHLLTEKFPVIFTVEVGVLLEMILFALGLGYKARLHEKQKIETELENLKLLHQNEINLLQVRSRLSRDLHDDIGSTLSSINILSRTAHTNLNQANDEKVKLSLEKINERSQRLLDNMSDIIWNINPGNDTIEEIMSRMREYATAVLEAKDIDYTFNFPKESISFTLAMEVKNNLYLIFKEAVNNLSKYSGCTKANFSLHFSGKSIFLSIEDNGIGFNQAEVKRHGGLTNMRDRAEEIQGELTIHSELHKGTTILLSIAR